MPPESCTSGHLSRALFNQAPSSRFSNTFSSSACGAKIEKGNKEKRVEDMQLLAAFVGLLSSSDESEVEWSSLAPGTSLLPETSLVSRIDKSEA